MLKRVLSATVWSPSASDLYRAETRKSAYDWVFEVGGCSAVFVDRVAEDAVAVDWGVERDDGVGVVVGWAMLLTLVWTVVVVVPGELVKHRDGGCLL
jgi:hypothetical protein